MDEKNKATVRMSMFTQMFEMRDVQIKVNAYVGEHKPLQGEQTSRLKKGLTRLANMLGVGRDARTEKSRPKQSSFKDTMRGR